MQELGKFDYKINVIPNGFSLYPELSIFEFFISQTFWKKMISSIWVKNLIVR